MKLFLLLALFASFPVAALVWVRWRFRPGRMQANADRLLLEVNERMHKLSDDELVRFYREHPYLNGPVRGSAAARRVRSLVDGRQFARLGEEWPQLWERLVEAENLKPGERAQLYDHALELGAATSELARRHPRT